MKAVASKTHREGRRVSKTNSVLLDARAALPQEYQAIFKNNGKPMVVVDDDTTISLANDEFVRISGYTKKEIEGTKKWTEFIARQDRRRMKEYHLLRKSDPMLTPRCCEFRFVDRHGKIKNVVLTIGQIPGTTKSMASLQDVTDRRQTDITQRADEERYQTFFENSRDAVYITTRDGTYVDANCAALDLFGYTREELKKLKARQLYANPADARRLQKEIEEKGFAQDFEVRLCKKDGTEMDCLFTVTVLRGDDGSILEYQAIARDVTEHKRAVETLRKSEERYRDILDSMLGGYFEVDLAGNFTFFNEAVAKFLGYLPDELKGLNYRKFTSPEEQQRLFQVFNEVYKTGNPHEIGDYEIIKDDGSIGIAAFSVSLLLNAAGEPIGFRGVTRDMTEERKTEATLQQSEENYRKILEMAPEGIAINRLKDERNVLVNDAFCRHTGYRREEIIGRSALELNLFCDRADHKRFAKTLRKEGRVEGLEISFWAKDGTILHDLVSARPIRFKGEDCVLVMATNINALKDAGEALRESEERYRSIIEDTEESYFETDLGGNYTFVNDAECKMLGYTREELIGMNYRQLSPETIAQKIYNSFNDSYKTGKTIKLMNQEITRKDGTKLIAEVSASLMKDSEGKPIGFRGIARDISKRTQAEERLRQSEERYRTILETIHDAYFELDLAGNFTFINNATCRHLGYTKEELIGMNNRAYTSPETAKKIREIFDAIYKEGKSSTIFDYEVIRKDGATITLELSVSLMRDVLGKPIGFRGISRDVTERKKIEEALRQSEEKYRTIIETMQEGYYELDLAGNFVLVNDAECRNLGYSREELIGMNNRKYQSEEEVKKSYQIFNEIYRTGKPVAGYAFEVTKKDGTTAIHEVSVSLMRDEQGNSIGFRGVSRDVTDRKEAEEKLRQSEDKYRTILETMWDGYWESDLAGNMTFANDAHCRMAGSNRERLIGMNNRQYTDEANAKKMYEVFNKVYETGDPVKNFEFEFIKRDETKTCAEISVALIRDAQGKPGGFRGVSRDVTDRKEAEEKLRQSEERYRTIIETMQDGYWEMDLAGNFTYVNDAECKIVGTPREQFIGSNIRQYTDEANAKRLYKISKGIYTTGEPVKSAEFEFIKRDGTKIFSEFSSTLRRDAQGKPIGYRGITRDVTDRKQAEEKLRQSEERYRTIVDTMEESYYELDLKGNFTLVNDKVIGDLGYTKEELIGTNSKQYRDGKNEEEIYRRYNELYKTGEPIRALEVIYVSKFGIPRTYELTASLIRDAYGKPIGFRGVSRDVTERKQMEDTLRQSEERYRTIVESMQDGYWETDLRGNFTFVNDAECRNLGYSNKEELIGINNRQYADETIAKKLYEAFHGVYETGEPITRLDIESIKKDGRKGFSEISVSLIRDAQGKPIGFRGVTRDVTERKNWEEALRQNEERYRTIVDTMQDGYWETDLAGNFTYVNDATCEMSGSSRERLIGRNNRQYMDETNAKKLYEAFHKVYTTGETLKRIDNEFKKRDGTKAFHEITAALITDAQGKPIGFRGISHDITELKQAEEKLRQSEERYRTMIETMQDGYWETDLPGNFTYVNDAECKIAGTPREQLLGKNNQQYTDATTAKKLYEVFKGMYTTGEPVKSCEFEFIKRNGTRAFAEFSASLRRNAEGKPIGFQGVTRDSTERKKAEEQLKRYAAELERSNEEVKNFAYIVSHDLRVPLVNLKGYTSELRSALGVIGANFDAALPHLNDEKRSEVAMALHEDVPEALEFIINSVSRMDSFINAVLILSRLGRQDLKPETLDMNAMVQAALDSMSHQIKEQGIEVHVGSLPQVVADRTAMERIVGNILSNAVKYVDPGRPCLIEVAAEANNGETIFTIRDTGRGIAKEDMHKVFAPFRRAGKQDTLGEGMGLSYVQTLVRRHDGRIWCESEPGKGTTFSFTIAATFKQGASDV